MPPATNLERTPRWAVFFSYAPADELDIFDIARRITRCGATVFLDEACIQSDPASHVLNAVSFADEVLILVTPTRHDPLNARSTPAFLDRRFLALAMGAAFARGIPIRGLLRGMGMKEVVGDPAIDVSIKKLHMFETVGLYEAYLLDRVRGAPLPSIRRPASRCRVCLFCASRKTSVLASIERRLQKAGIESNRWHPEANVDLFDAVAVLVGDGASEAWTTPELVGFLRAFVSRFKPVVLLVLPGAPEVPDWLAPASFVEFRESDDLSFLQLVWAMFGYRRYGLGEAKATSDVLEKVKAVPHAFICHSSKDLQAVKTLMQKFRDAGIHYWVDHEQIQFGDSITAKIEEGLQHSQYVIVCLSGNLGKSNWCRAEYGPILNRECGPNAKRRVIPVKLDDCSDDDIPILLYDKRRADFAKPDEMSELLRFLGG